MPQFYFNIPLSGHPALVQVQNYLRRLLPEATNWQAPDTFHITLLAVDDAKGIDLKEMKVPVHLPVFGVTSWALELIKVKDGYAVVLRLARTQALDYLQMALYLEASATGVVVGAYSYPFAYRPHITMAYINDLPEYWDIYGIHEVPLEVTTFALTSENYTQEKAWELLRTLPIAEQRAMGIDTHLRKVEQVFSIAEAIKGPMPEISLPADIDLNKLAQALGKSSPSELVFDTRPIGMVTKSRNNRNYGEKFVRNLVEQANAKRVEGRWGHLKDEDIGSIYEMPAIRWLAAYYDPKTQVAWGKCLALTKEAEKHILSAQAANARIGTSIYGFDPVSEGEEIVSVDLVTIDLANAEMVGIPDMSTVPKVSSEMVAGIIQAEETNTMPIENQVTQPASTSAPLTPAQETNVERLRTLLDARERQISELEIKSDEHSSICELMGVAEGGDVVQAVRRLRTANAELSRENQDLLGMTVDALVQKEVAIESVRPIVKRLVVDEKPSTRKAVEQAVAKALETEEIQTLLAIKVAETAGPNVASTGKPVGESRHTAAQKASEGWVIPPS